jgi:hypothetical protein
MEPKWAEENLQTIRTLMERSAVYRRALAPIMLCAGSIGIVAAVMGILFDLNSPQEFTVLWLGTALGVITVALFVARRQAVNSNERFWSLPTRRVAQALFPSLMCGMLLGEPFIFGNERWDLTCLPFFWALFFGLAIYAAGFFMPRSVRWFGGIYIIVGCIFWTFYVLDGIIYPYELWEWLHSKLNGQWLMGFFFGVLHLAYGAYLYLTERKNPVA